MVNSKIKKVQIYSNTGFIEKARYLDDYYLNKIFQVTRNEDLTLDEKSKKIIFIYFKKNFKKIYKIFVFDYGYLSVFDELLYLVNNNKEIQRNL